MPARAGQATLFVPTGGVDTISSLRAPCGGGVPTQKVDVQVVPLDEFAAAQQVATVDLIKLDVEGGEMEVLAGAERLLRERQPCWMFEALDVTAAAWQGSGRALVERFLELGHQVFEFTPEGWLQPHELKTAYPHVSNCNLLAVPAGKVDQIRQLLVP